MSCQLYQLAPQTHTQMMGYVLQTDDALIVLDGGNAGDAPFLRELLHRLGGAQPHITAWFLTHPHHDHVGAFVALMEGSDAPVVEQVTYYEYVTEHARPAPRRHKVKVRRIPVAPADEAVRLLGREHDIRLILPEDISRHGAAPPLFLSLYSTRKPRLRKASRRDFLKNPRLGKKSLFPVGFCAIIDSV